MKYLIRNYAVMELENPPNLPAAVLTSMWVTN